MPNDKLPSCKCKYLERESNISDSPIRFDPDLNEYNFVYRTTDGGEAKLSIYHCPFCGGRAPKSKRSTLWATLSWAERFRLIKLTKHLRTLDDVLRAFGQPDTDDAAGLVVSTPGWFGKPEKTQGYRVLAYTKLSDTADVHVTVYPTDKVGFTFQGKYIGKSKA